MRLDTKTITFLSIITATLVVGGYFLYIISKALVVPGSKFILMAPYLSLFMYIAVSKVKKRWTISVLNLLFGTILMMMSPFMAIAIFSSGILTDVTSIILFRNYEKEINIKMSATIYSVWSFIISAFITNYVTGNNVNGSVGAVTLLLLSIVIFALGFIGAMIGEKIKNRIFGHVNHLRM